MYYNLIIAMFFDVANFIELTKKIIPSARLSPRSLPRLWRSYISHIKQRKFHYHFFLTEKIFSYAEIVVKNGLHRHQGT